MKRYISFFVFRFLLFITNAVFFSSYLLKTRMALLIAIPQRAARACLACMLVICNVLEQSFRVKDCVRFLLLCRLLEKGLKSSTERLCSCLVISHLTTLQSCEQQKLKTNNSFVFYLLHCLSSALLTNLLYALDDAADPAFRASVGTLPTFLSFPGKLIFGGN